MDRIFFRGCMITVLGLLFLMLMIPTQIQAGIGGKCPEIQITWQDLVIYKGEGLPEEYSDLSIFMGIMELQTSAWDSVDMKLWLCRGNKNGSCTDTVMYIVTITAGVCVWHAPEVDCEIIDNPDEKLRVFVTQGDYTEEKKAYIKIETW